MILPVALLLASAAPVTLPQPRLPIQSLFSRDDYPAAADGRHVPVGVNLAIDTQGRVIGCLITRSSGLGVLDAATCNILRRRERFAPAVDGRGAPVIGTVDETVDW